jgi:hypothetical protein
MLRFDLAKNLAVKLEAYLSTRSRVVMTNLARKLKGIVLIFGEVLLSRLTNAVI